LAKSPAAPGWLADAATRPFAARGMTRWAADVSTAAGLILQRDLEGISLNPLVDPADQVGRVSNV